MTSILRSNYKSLRKRDGNRCYYCHIPLTVAPRGGFFTLVKSNYRSKAGKGLATIDHVVPKSKGGTDNRDNLVLCCWECNTEKADMSFEKFFEKKAKARMNR